MAVPSFDFTCTGCQLPYPRPAAAHFHAGPRAYLVCAKCHAGGIPRSGGCRVPGCSNPAPGGHSDRCYHEYALVERRIRPRPGSPGRFDQRDVHQCTRCGFVHRPPADQFAFASDEAVRLHAAGADPIAPLVTCKVKMKRPLH